MITMNTRTIKESFLKIITLLVIIAIVSVLTVPVSAAVGEPWSTRFSYFPLCVKNATAMGYAMLIQRTMQLYNSTTRALLIGSGSGTGVDGDFGNNTEAAIMAFQTAKGLGVDGMVGTATWSAMASCYSFLQMGSPAVSDLFWMNTSDGLMNVFYPTTYNAPYVHYPYNGNGYQSSVSFSRYY